MDRKKQNRLSAEWAAYGDALGFMTELADAKRVKYRVGKEVVEQTIPWKRKVGGYHGQTFELPAGTYSDDTQLRLSTSRAIRSNGTFDVAAFAKVELPAWANYALGAGVGSKAAASNLSRTSATWYSNFFDTKKARYVNAGGNGAAMRVQPHVWASSDLLDMNKILLDVIKNAICTHGHMRGVLGACFHAISLAFALYEGRAAQLDECSEFIERLRSVPKLIGNDGDLRAFWLGAWSDASGVDIQDAISQVIDEISLDLKKLEALKDGQFSEVYPRAVRVLGAFDDASRGSGTKTAILASFVASRANNASPHDHLLIVANMLGSDTDSIATMAGAIIGACTDQECGNALQDRDYICTEAQRLTDISEQRETSSFRYPNLRNWRPEKTAIDAIGVIHGGLYLNGIGYLKKYGPSSLKGGDKEKTGWFKLPFGQKVLVRFRSQPRQITGEEVMHERNVMTSDKNPKPTPEPPSKLHDLFHQTYSSENVQINSDIDQMTLSEILRKVIAEGFPADLIGQVLLKQVDNGGKEYLEKGVALTANILTAYEARTKHKRK